MTQRDAAEAVPGEDAERVHLHVGSELLLDALPLGPLLDPQLAEAERAVVFEERARSETATHAFPVAARTRAPERGDRAMASARRLTGREAGVRLRERGAAVVEVEPDHRARPALGVDLDQVEVFSFHGASLEPAPPHHALERDPL